MFSLILTVTAAQQILKSSPTTIKLPLTLDPSRQERMSLTYWTSLKETNDCILDPYECSLDEYEKWFEGELSLENVQTSGWNPIYSNGADNLEMRLEFNETDVLIFNYDWNAA